MRRDLNKLRQRNRDVGQLIMMGFLVIFITAFTINLFEKLATVQPNVVAILTK